MSLEDEIRASQQRIKKQMDEETRRKYLEQQMQEWSRKTGMGSTYSCEVVGIPSELHPVYNEIVGIAAFKERMVIGTAPNGHTYIRRVSQTNDKHENGNIRGFVVLLRESGTGKDRQVDEIWFLRDGRCTFILSNRAAIWSDFRKQYSPAQVRQKAIDAIAKQRISGTASPAWRVGTTGSSGSSKSNSTQSSENCYIATAVYGSYDCPEVRVFRRFRDERLKKTVPGRAFIRTYYAISPQLVRRFGDSPRFILVWRRYLDGKLHRLQEKGYGNEDRLDG